ncbi:MAG: hypothetical protein COB23_07060 [Methylophaga sp.]|nr:MAG: hypothetical protein COB23_07060 [Methylophaga sp.]
MHKYLSPLILGITLLILAINANANAEGSIAVEWAPFIKASGVSDQELIKAADIVNIHFLASQKGFIKRELVKKSDSEYADIIHWQTKDNAITAGNAVGNCVQCGEYFKLMDMEASSKAGAGFSHYEIIKTW